MDHNSTKNANLKDSVTTRSFDSNLNQRGYPSLPFKELRKQLREDYGVVDIWFDKYDIESVLDGMGYQDVSDEDIDLIIERLHKYHDAEVGLNWFTIEFYCEQVMEEKNNM